MRKFCLLDFALQIDIGSCLRCILPFQQIVLFLDIALNLRLTIWLTFPTCLFELSSA